MVHYIIRWVWVLLTLSGSVGLCYSFFCNGFVTFICAFPKPKKEEEQTIVLCFFGNTFTVIVLYCCYNYFEPDVLDNMILSLRQLQLMSCNFRQCCNWSQACNICLWKCMFMFSDFTEGCANRYISILNFNLATSSL
jgi:hypothetical protein